MGEMFCLFPSGQHLGGNIALSPIKSPCLAVWRSDSGSGIPDSVWNLDKLPHAGSYLLLITDKNFTQLVWLVWLRKSFIFLIIYKAPSQAAPHFLPVPPVGNYSILNRRRRRRVSYLYLYLYLLCNAICHYRAWPWTLNWGAQRCWIFNIYCFQQEI